ncbi:Bromodomain-containing protein [Lentinula raphanica]|nr:Bromodomain-containing protein [Lentinula raphanica]
MTKRDRGFTTMEGGPSKRRRAEEAGSDVEMAAANEDAVEEEEREEQSLEEKAMYMWQTVKDAMKDGRPLSLQFLKQPNPRIYPDYYAIIRNPIALEDIKKKIQSGKYTDLESVRKDFELCFNNAKDYNLQESVIYNDAKDLLKLANKTYRKLAPSEPGEKSKPPSMKKLLNSRIQKLMKKTDDNGRIMSTMFMELPSKKEWPTYYKQIPEPRCLETIQKQVKRKEYKTVSEFAADVELVFSNAMTFNMEHTPIWEDALTLRDYFRQLMADLPPPYALPQYATHTPKIRIKMSAIQSTAHTTPKIEEPSPASSLPVISLRVPAPVKVPASKPSDVKAQSPEPVKTLTVVKASASPVPTPTPVITTPDVGSTEPASNAKSSTTQSSVNQVPPAQPAPKLPVTQPLKPSTTQTAPKPPIAQPTPTPTPKASLAQTAPTPKLSLTPQTTKPIAQPIPKSIAAHPVHKSHLTAKASKAKASTPRTPQTNTPQPILQLHPTMSVYSNNTLPKTKQASYVQPSPTPAPSAATIAPSYITSLASTSVQTPAPVLATPPPPSPVIPANHQLRHITLRTEPRGRHLKLDHQDGVTKWAMPLERDEKSVCVQEIIFMAEAGESSGEEDDGEDDTAEMDVDGAPEPEPVKKRRGRPPKVVKAPPASKPKTAPVKKKKQKKRSEVVVKVNGATVKEDEERSGKWKVELTVGRNVLEIGEQGGLIWTVYAERVG